MEAAKRVEKLLHSAFTVEPGDSFYDDYAVWDPRFASVTGSRCFSAQDGKAPVAIAFARMARLATPQGLVPVGIIGGVTTRPSHRGRGLASKVVEEAYAWLRAEGAELAILWGNETGLYQKLGFKPTGQQLRSGLARFRGLPESREIVREGWVPSLFECLRERRAVRGLELRDVDRAWIEAHCHVRWFYTGPREKPTAYAAYGRGIDLGGIVHEWGGDRPALMQILRSISLRQPKAELLGNPELFFELAIKPTTPPEPVALVRGLADYEAPESFWIWGLDSA
jgi:GNAT superfamily N-acetyltransferase